MALSLRGRPHARRSSSLCPRSYAAAGRAARTRTDRRVPPLLPPLPYRTSSPARKNAHSPAARADLPPSPRKPFISRTGSRPPGKTMAASSCSSIRIVTSRTGSPPVPWSLSIIATCPIYILRPYRNGRRIMETLHGVCTITLTPFTDEGDVDLEGIDSLTDLYLNSGVHGLTILGIMGEAHKLSDAERQAVTERYISATGGSVPVIVGCSAMAT